MNGIKCLFGKCASRGRFTTGGALSRAVAFAVDALEGRTFLSAGQLDPTFGSAGIVTDYNHPPSVHVVV